MILKLPYYRPARMPTLHVAVTRATPIGRICRSFRQLGYISVPLRQLSRQRIPCGRDKGLGGSSAVSFLASR
jgi:hypothetical protein